MLRSSRLITAMPPSTPSLGASLVSSRRMPFPHGIWLTVPYATHQPGFAPIGFVLHASAMAPALRAT
ncbi:unnamed protein product [Periconia digitata]|uniref:Uncharacterized protein n=1 Tax=Periconia digitata TaxID=1303443 RepID=A0A9W4UC12_9PLEO|nr:unnamed protein product [Periconia digitata]